MIAKALLAVIAVLALLAGFCAWQWKATEAAFNLHIAEANERTVDQITAAVAKADRRNALRSRTRERELRDVRAELERVLDHDETAVADCDNDLPVCARRVVDGLFGGDRSSVRETASSDQPVALQ